MIPISMPLNEMLVPKLSESEYLGDDGLIHCGRCHGRRQLVVTVDGMIYYPRALCPCQRAALEAREREQKALEQRDRIQRNRSLGLQEPMLRGYTFRLDKGYDPELMEKMHRYVANWEQMYQRGMGLLLWGDVGTGKSYAAGCIANALLDQGVSVMMTNFSRILNALSSLQQGGAHCNSEQVLVDQSLLMAVQDGFAAQLVLANGNGLHSRSSSLIQRSLCIQIGRAHV